MEDKTEYLLLKALQCFADERLSDISDGEDTRSEISITLGGTNLVAVMRILDDEETITVENLQQAIDRGDINAIDV